MANEKFEYKSNVKYINQNEITTGNCNTDGLKCDWEAGIPPIYAPYDGVLRFLWKFNWDELKKRGINRLSGYIIVKPAYGHFFCHYFDDHKFDVDIKPNSIISKFIKISPVHSEYAVKFEYSFIPHYTQVEEVIDDSSSVQNDTILVVDEDKNNTNEENLSSDSDEMCLPSDQNDAILVIDGRKIHVNKWFLSYHSEFFRNLFTLDCKDGKVNEIPLGGISIEDFKLLIGPISLKPTFPTDETVKKLLELATRFKVSFVIHQCEHHLLHMSKLGIEKKMLMGEQYGMLDLLEKSIREMDTIEKAKKWKLTPEYSMLSGDTKSRVLEKLI